MKQFLFQICLCFLILLTGCQEIVQHKTLNRPIKNPFQELLAPAPHPHEWQNQPLKKVDPQTLNLPKEYHQEIALNLTESIPLKETLYEISKLLNLRISIDNELNDGITLSTGLRPFSEILDEICLQGKLRAFYRHGILRIEADKPYAKTYSLQFLNFSRESENKMSTSTDVFFNGYSLTNNKPASSEGSRSAVTIQGKSDFWDELDKVFKIIMASGGTYSFHRQAGLVSLFGTKSQHDLIEDYLLKLQQTVSSQVLIEAKIIEVTLNDDFRSGIDWQKIQGSGDFRVNMPFGNMATKGRFTDPSRIMQETIMIGAQQGSFKALLSLLEEFGTSRTLASPRLTVMNNQVAVLKVAQNQVYFRLRYDRQFVGVADRETINVGSDAQTVPIGLVMSVQPSIDLQTGQVILFLRPTVSRFAYSVPDPAVEIAKTLTTAAAEKDVPMPPSLVPVVDVREMDSVLRIKSGETAVLGGLMEVRSQDDSQKVPVLGDIPIIKEAFSNVSKTERIVELVIFLRATIIDDRAKLHPTDHRLRSFVSDPRP